NINPSMGHVVATKDPTPEQVDFEVIVTESNLYTALNRLTILVSHPNPTLNNLLLKPLALALWALLSFAHKTKKLHWQSIVKGLLQSYFKVSAGILGLDILSRNLLFDGDAHW